MTLLRVENLAVSYGAIKALHGINLTIEEGEIVSLLGANGAGKSTTLRAISRMLPLQGGDIFYRDQSVKNIPAHQLVAMGIGHVPEGRGIFPNLTVQENLALAAWTQKNKQRLAASYEKVFALFPRLEERRPQLGGTLSGGEQQMLAVARILRTGARLLLLDEISEGLAPVIVQKLAEMVRMLRTKGYTIVMVEQNFRFAAPLADRFMVMEHGEIQQEFTQAQLPDRMAKLHEYLGV